MYLLLTLLFPFHHITLCISFYPFSLSSYQQGRGNVQITCVPDESAPMLGANGFVNGVTPGNVGLSFNINL